MALDYATTDLVLETANAPSAQETLRTFTTAKELSALAQEFFTRVTGKYITYFLSCELSNYVGPDSRFSNIDRHAEFNSGLDLYCRQASRIIEQFSWGWFSKGNFAGPITQKKAGGYVHIALKKLRAELAEGAPVGA